MNANNDALTIDVIQKIIDEYAETQQQAWDSIRKCSENNTVPNSIPDDAVIFVASNVYKVIPLMTALSLKGRLFENKLLEDDTLLVMKRPSDLFAETKHIKPQYKPNHIFGYYPFNGWRPIA